MEERKETIDYPDSEEARDSNKEDTTSSSGSSDHNSPFSQLVTDFIDPENGGSKYFQYMAWLVCRQHHLVRPQVNNSSQRLLMKIYFLLGSLTEQEIIAVGDEVEKLLRHGTFDEKFHLINMFIEMNPQFKKCKSESLEKRRKM